MIKVLILNNILKPCGVQQWGERLRFVLKDSEKYAFIYRETGSCEDVTNILLEINPEIVLYNYNPSTLYYLTSDILDQFKHIKHVAIIHEGYSYKDNYVGFDYFIYLVKNIDIDRDMAHRVFNTDVRYTLDYRGPLIKNRIPTIGSFGFGFPNKRFDYIVEAVNKEFNVANIRFHMSRSIHGDPDGALIKDTILRCRSKITKPGIRLIVTSNFVTDQALLLFLARNDVNCFFYDDTKTDGIAGSTDLALSVKRPIAITKVPMFSHLYDLVPSACIENSTLKQIISMGVKPLELVYAKFSQANFNAEIAQILDRIIGAAL